MTRRALELAERGVGLVSPSPLVGCVIVSPDLEIVGEGTYEYDRVTHAEVIALTQAGARARGATAYVSLEPHSYHGRTAPCTSALIEAGIKRVVCPMRDPNPLVSGRGFDVLRSHGIEVVTGILREEARRLNEKFRVWHQARRPFIHLKLATSLDGRISLQKSVSTAISCPEATSRVHALRHEHDAILVGGNTVAVDDPSLTDRSGKRRRRPLVRVILDNRLRIRTESNLCRTAGEIPTIVVTNSVDVEKLAAIRSCGVEIISQDSRDLEAVLGKLRDAGIQSVLVEGGTSVAGSFRDAGLVDKYTLMIAPILIGGDAPVAIGGIGPASIDEVTRLTDVCFTRHGTDLEITGYPSNEPLTLS